MRLTLTVKKSLRNSLKIDFKYEQKIKAQKRNKCKNMWSKASKTTARNHFQRPGLGAEISDAPAWALKLSACQKFSFQKCSSFYPHTTEK